MSAPGQPQHPNGQHFQQHYPSSQSQWDGATGAVQSFGNGSANAMSAQSNTNTSGKDAIREGKQRARETMAAAGVSPAASTSQDTLSNGAGQTNGAPQLSRKRSRDGSQIPITQASGTRESANTMTPEHQESLLERAIQRDLLYESCIIEADERSARLIEKKRIEKDFYKNEVRQRRQMNPGSVFGPGFMGYGNRTTDGKNQIVYNTQRGPPKGRRLREPYLSRKDVAQQAEQREELVPVRLDIELDKLRLRDTFTWNLHEKLISQEVFADFLLEDLKIPPENFHDVARQVKAEMQDQIQNFYPHVIVEDGPLEPGRPYSDHKDDEMRILIKLNITIGRITLVDQFEWDINNPQNSPEEFARQMAWENALSGEFTTAIAHTIREQSQLYTRSLWLTNHCFDGRPIDDPDLRDGFLPNPIYSAFRPHQAQKDWTPYMYEMSEAELERTETSMMREHRAQKRQLNRRGGPALPDLKDRQRTVRSLIVHSVIPGAVETFETTGIPKTRRSGRSGRRAGARVDGDADTDEMESDDSGADSPAPSMANAGTARTRGMRGAASAAQAAMRAGFGRSETPDVQATPHETRTAARRSNLREDEVPGDEDSLIVKLKIGRAKLKAFWTEYEAKKRASQYPLSGYASQPPLPPSAAAAAAVVATTAAAAGNAPATPSRAAAPTTPRSVPAPSARNQTPQPNGSGASHQRASSSSAGPAARQKQQQQQIEYDSQGRADTDHWPDVDDPPFPPPPWLTTAIATLRSMHPASDFEPIMRPYTMNAATGVPEKTNLEPGALPPAGLKVQFLPRIRCNDCPGKLYTAVQGKVVEDFQVHLKNRRHLEKVASRRGEGK